MRKLVAVILAGGAGSRFWPLTTHKILFPFFGKPFISYSVASVLPKEVERAVVVTNSENRETLRNVSFPVQTTTVVQRNPLGMADALLTAEAEIADSSLLILIADDLINGSLLDDVVKKAQHSRAFGVLPGWKTPHYFPGGYFVFKGNSIAGVSEKPGMGNEPSPYVNITGHYIVDSNLLLSELKNTKSDHDDVYEKTLSRLMEHQEFELVPYEGPYASLKYPWDVLSCMDQLLAGKSSHKGKNVEIRQNVTIEGPVYIQDNVRIMENTKIVGPCFIGENTIVGNNNIVRSSHIGKNCITGFSTDITRSYVGDNCWFHSNYVGDSVLEGNISMGAGSVLANLRLDERAIASTLTNQKVNTFRNKLGGIVGSDVRIGVNASIMPGIKIGSRSFVGAGVVLDKDLPDECYCTNTCEYAVSKNLHRIESNRDEFKKHLS